MDVHAHTHTQRKKWTHYLWEFLMLFLAVFCGFLAENFREHLIDHRKEKDFVNSLLEDLKKDTARLNYGIRRLKGDITYTDSLVILYVKGNKENNYQIRMSRYGQAAGHSVDIVFNDRTSSQLKGTGSMRLIRKKALADSIAQYWNNQIKIAQIHDRFETFRVEQRKIGWETFGWYRALTDKADSIRIDNNQFGLSFKQLTRINNEQILSEFMNVTATLYDTAIWQFLPELETEFSLANNLILLIKKEYHLN